MAIRDDNTPPSKPGSITQTADNQIDRIGNVSNVSKTVSSMQKDVKQQITETKHMVDESEAISSVQSSMTKVLDKLSDTIGVLSSGVKTITVDTARATKDAIGDYSKAISADISFNKQSVVAMALARSTPIYGYFVAKFMETDVFKRAAERMKQSIGKAFGSLAGLFRRGAKEPGKEKIPHMAKGGYVEKEGLAKIHAGEVVMPIEKILDRMDDNTNVAKNVSKILTKLTLSQASSSKAMSRMVLAQTEEGGGKRVGLIKDTLRFIREGKERYKNPTEIRQLRELIAIREVLGGEIKIWPEVWSKLLMKHPGFRNMMAVSKAMINFTLLTTWKPVYALFKRRGGYARYLSKNSKPLNALNQNMGLQYVESMWRYDNMLNLLKAIAVATRDTAATITGKKYGRLKGVGTGEWSLGGSMVRVSAWLAGMGMRGVGKITGMGALGKAGKFLTGGAFSTKAKREYALGGSGGGKLEQEGKKNLYQSAKLIMKRFKKEEKTYPKKLKNDQKLLEWAGERTKLTRTVKKSLKQKKWVKWLLIGFTFISSWIKKFWDKSVGKLLKFGGKKFASWMGLKGLGQFGAKKGAQGTIGRAMGKIPPGMKKVMGAGGIAAGVAMGVYDAMQAVAMSDKWKTSKTSAGIGGFLGGTGSGMGGALKGAAKGGMLGAGIGSFVPVIGTAVGGAIGAIAGGIMGFVGGKNLAKGFDAMGSYIKKFALAAWKIVTHPFGLIGLSWDWFKKHLTWKNVGKLAISSLGLVWKSLKFIIKLPYKAIWWILKKAGPTIGSLALGAAKGIGSMVKDLFSMENIKKGLQTSMNALFGVFSWIGDLFVKLKDYVVRGITDKLPKWLGGTDPKNGKPKEKPATETGGTSYKNIWGGIKKLWGSDKPKDLAKQAQKGAEEAIKKTKNSTSSVLNKMTPKAREAFETAKKYYMKEFGWTEVQADAVLQTIATTAGDKLDLFSDPTKLKGMGSSMYNTVKDRSASSVDKGKIVINQAALMLANGELIAEDLGKKIVESSKELGKQTLQGAGAVVSTVSTAITNINTTNSSAVSTGGSKSIYEKYFPNLVYTGNYR